jgi:hypothetical protein
MVGQIEYAPISMSLEEVAACSSHKVLMEVDNSILLIVGDPQKI